VEWKNMPDAKKDLFDGKDGMPTGAEYIVPPGEYGWFDADGYVSNSYGMFSLAGDIMVEDVVGEAIEMGHDFDTVDKKLATTVGHKHSEVTDTSVRNHVWEVMMGNS